MDIEQAIRERYKRLENALDERARRLFVATEALSMGYGGIARVRRATGVAARTIGAGIRELKAAGERNPRRPQRELRASEGPVGAAKRR